jgi:hypothetical protein
MPMCQCLGVIDAYVSMLWRMGPIVILTCWLIWQVGAPPPPPSTPHDRWFPPTPTPTPHDRWVLLYPTPTPPDRWVPPTPTPTPLDRWVPPPIVVGKCHTKCCAGRTQTCDLSWTRPNNASPTTTPSHLLCHTMLSALYVDNCELLGLEFGLICFLFWQLTASNGPTAQSLIANGWGENMGFI